MKQRKNYSQEFKKNAVSLSQDREGNLGALAMELGIRTGLLYDWRSQYLEKRTHSKSKPNIVWVNEEKSIRKENERLHKENEILKKAL